MLRLIFLLISILFVHVVYPQTEWVLQKEKDGILIYSLKTDSSKFNSIKVETELPGKIEDLVSIVTDVENHYKWAYGTKSATVLKRISEREIIFYKELKSPNLVSNRDMVVHLKVISTPATKSVTIESIALPNFMPLKENLVRVPVSNERWIISSTTVQKMKIIYYLQIDPGGALPAVLVNLFISRGPYESFENLKKLLQDRIRN